ncbi:MAG: TMEM43 family protein [Bacteroidales bacterium]|nr:TMEM43 family protein [Bacteroidales bacterium]
MAHQVKTTTSYGQRLSNSFKGIATGFGMLIIGTILLFWNEGNFVKTKKSLQEAEGILVKVSDVSTIDPSLNGKLIHASAFADTKDLLADEMFGVSETAISINRKVEYYQYTEQSSSTTKDKIGGGQETITTYTYEMKWTSSPVNSGKFNDPDYRSSNFTLANVEARTEYAKNVSFGEYKLPSFIITSISGSVPAQVNFGEEERAQWEKAIADKRAALNLQPDTIPVQRVHASDNVVYFGKSTAVPSVGDVRITLSKTMPADISIIARVNGSTFESYVASNGKTVSKTAMGTVSSEKMFADAHSSNSTWTWILRFIGIFLVMGGLKAMFGFLPTLFKVLPFLGDIVGAGVGLVCSIVGGAWSLVVIAIAWLWYRPLIGIAFLLVAAAGIWLLKKKGKKVEIVEKTEQ